MRFMLRFEHTFQSHSFILMRKYDEKMNMQGSCEEIIWTHIVDKWVSLTDLCTLLVVF